MTDAIIPSRCAVAGIEPLGALQELLRAYGEEPRIPEFVEASGVLHAIEAFSCPLVGVVTLLFGESLNFELGTRDDDAGRPFVKEFEHGS